MLLFFSITHWCNEENGDVVVLVRNDCEFFSSVAECVPNFVSFRTATTAFCCVFRDCVVHASWISTVSPDSYARKLDQ